MLFVEFASDTLLREEEYFITEPNGLIDMSSYFEC